MLSSSSTRTLATATTASSSLLLLLLTLPLLPPKFASAQSPSGCPPVPPYMNDYCPTYLDPVTCNPNSGSNTGLLCTYRTECHAAAAGMNLNSCRSTPINPGTQCPKPGGSTGCPASFDPVFCTVDGLGCTYDNLCIANAAGAYNCYSNQPSCPTIPTGGGGCTTEYDPVYCTVNNYMSCTYPNQCTANRACQGGGYTCDCTSGPEDECPASSSSCNKPQNAQPWLCGSQQIGMPRVPADCWYVSKSCFQSANWVESDCCKQPPIPSSEADDDCAKKGYNPAVCGNKDCIYHNMCYAIKAGFNSETQCSRCDPDCYDTCTSPTSKQVGQGQRPRTCKGATTSSGNPMVGSAADGNSTMNATSTNGNSTNATSQRSGSSRIGTAAGTTAIMLLVSSAFCCLAV